MNTYTEVFAKPFGINAVPTYGGGGGGTPGDLIMIKQKDLAENQP